MGHGRTVARWHRAGHLEAQRCYDKNEFLFRPVTEHDAAKLGRRGKARGAEMANSTQRIEEVQCEA